MRSMVEGARLGAVYGKCAPPRLLSRQAARHLMRTCPLHRACARSPSPAYAGEDQRPPYSRSILITWGGSETRPSAAILSRVSRMAASVAA